MKLETTIGFSERDEFVGSVSNIMTISTAVHFWWLLPYAESPKCDLKDTEEACLPEKIYFAAVLFLH